MTLEDYNAPVLDRLIHILTTVYTSPNLLIIDRLVAPIVDFLTNILKLRSLAKFDHLVYLDAQVEKSTLDEYQGLILIVDCTSNAVNQVLDLVAKCPIKKVHLIVKDLTRLFVYNISNSLKGSVSFESLTTDPELHKPFRITSQVKVSRWSVTPLMIDSNVFSLEMAYGGLHSYMFEPVQMISRLADSFLALLNSFSGKNMLKVKNFYAKGDHASLLVSMIKEEKMRQYLSTTMNPLQQEFYLNKYPGNADVVVLERNLDMASVAMNQLNYQGLIDDLFELRMNELSILGTKYVVKDDLYHDIKHLNFASIGSKLNQLARYVQDQYKQKDNLADISEIRKLVKNLGNLTSKQDLIKKHTTISEAILSYIKFGTINEKPTTVAGQKYNQYEQFIEFENEVFDDTYKLLVSKINQFVNDGFDIYLVTCLLVLVSVVHDGIKEKDYEHLHSKAFENFGIEVSLLWEPMISCGVLKLSKAGPTDFFGAFAGFGINLSQPKSPEPVQDEKELRNLGISGGQWTQRSNYVLLSKFWNLHPLVEDEEEPKKTGELVDEYPHPSFALPGNTVPLLVRFVEALYSRRFLKYRPVNNVSRRSNWDGLQLDTMFAGKQVDINVCDVLETKRTSSSEKNYVVIMVIGGITRGEISCLKFLEQQLRAQGIDKHFLIVTSGIVNQHKLVDAFRHLE